MSGKIQTALRAVLLAHPDGLTGNEAGAAADVDPRAARSALAHMPDVYIDRWQRNTRGPMSAVFIAVPIPADCPRPGK